MSTFIDRILAEVCLDERIPDGIFDLCNNSHMDVLRENLTEKFGIAINDAKQIHNKMLEGKYPERQAYNKDGLLVTFPTPQHKAKAIQRGTHFEKDPTKGQTNVFAGSPQAAAQPQAQPAPQPQAQQKPAPAGQQASQLPASDTPPPAQDQKAKAGQSAPTKLPTSDIPTPTAIPQAPPPTAPSAPSDTQGLAVEPNAIAVQGPTPPSPPPTFDIPKTSEQKAAEAEAVKQLMHGDNTNQTLQPSLNERRYLELNRVLAFATQMGYAQAAKVISEAMNIK